MWINTHDCTVVDMIAIGAHSVATTNSMTNDGVRPSPVTVKRHEDLGTDLATALSALRLRLPPPI
jgi:hypothetical protein